MSGCIFVAVLLMMCSLVGVVAIGYENWILRLSSGIVTSLLRLESSHHYLFSFSTATDDFSINRACKFRYIRHE